MKKNKFIVLVAIAVLFGGYGLFSVYGPAIGPSQAASEVEIEWLTWGFYRITSPGGKVILINPWYTNPDSSITLDDIPEADIILVTSGHSDEIGNTLEIGAKTGAAIVASHEVVVQKFREEGADFSGPIVFDGVESPAYMVQPSSLITIDGITIRVVPSAHGDWNTGGPALGYFITMEDGFTVYYSGGTDLTMDMKLWGELFQPDVALLYFAANPDPRTVALMAQFLSENNPNLKTIMPQHQPLKPEEGRATPADLGIEMAKLGLKAELIDPEPGVVYKLSK